MQNYKNISLSSTEDQPLILNAWYSLVEVGIVAVILYQGRKNIEWNWVLVLDNFPALGY